MRLTSEFWVAAFSRKIYAQNGFFYLVKKGAKEAGTIFITVYNQDSQVELYGPAPQIFYISRLSADDRLFIRIISNSTEEEVKETLKKELAFDPDIWIIEVENFNGINGLIDIIKNGNDTPSASDLFF